MKKTLYILLAVAALALTACNEKPAKADKQATDTTEASAANDNQITPVDLDKVVVEELKVKPTGDAKKDGEALATATIAFSDKMGGGVEVSQADSIQLENLMKEFTQYYKGKSNSDEFKTAFETAMLALLEKKMAEQNKNKDKQ